MRYTAAFIILLLFGSCSKEKLSPGQVETIVSGTTNDLYDVCFISDTEGYIAGGNTFYENILLKTTDGGRHWEPMSILDNDHKTINTLYYYDHRKMYAVGLDGKVYVNYLNSENIWHLHQNIWWEWIRDIYFYRPDSGIVVTGRSWSYGAIHKVDSFGQVIQRDTFEFELNDLLVKGEHYLVSGYGAILLSRDKGTTWKHTNASGDHFIKMTEAGPHTLWAIGQYGTILKSTDDGQSWQKDRNGSNPLKNRLLFNNIAFRDADKGIIIGNKGLIMFTSNGGKNWKKLDTFTDEDLNGIFLFPDKAVITGSKGSIYMLKTSFF